MSGTLRASLFGILTIGAAAWASAASADPCLDECDKLAALCARSQGADEACEGAPCTAVCDEMRSKCASECAAPKEAIAEPAPAPPPAVTPAPVEPAPEAALLGKVAELEGDWRAVRTTLLGDGFSQETRVKAVREFLEKHDYENRHSASARELLAMLEAGKTVGKKDLRRLHDFDRGFTPEVYRRKVEWLTLGATVGIYGAGGRLTLFTLRWDHFYWNMVRGNFTSGWLGLGGHGGTGIGVPFHLGGSGRHEVRLGAGVEAGLVYVWDERESCRNHGTEWALVDDESGMASWQEVPIEQCGYGNADYWGVLPYLELLYSRHVRPRYGWEVGLAVYLLLPSMTQRYVSMDDGSSEDWMETGFWMAPNAYLFVGFTI